MTLEELGLCGFDKRNLELPSSWQKLVSNCAWEELYQECLAALNDGHWLHSLLKSLVLELSSQGQFSHEMMLALRQGPQDLEEEGIWHDDGSRDFALSLSLNREPETIQGGDLLLRTKQYPQDIKCLSTLPWGQFWLFPTGKYGWDHRTTRVSYGNRLVLVIWVTIGLETLAK